MDEFTYWTTKLLGPPIIIGQSKWNKVLPNALKVWTVQKFSLNYFFQYMFS